MRYPPLAHFNNLVLSSFNHLRYDDSKTWLDVAEDRRQTKVQTEACDRQCLAWAVLPELSKLFSRHMRTACEVLFTHIPNPDLEVQFRCLSEVRYEA
jgi:hypothetical protein